MLPGPGVPALGPQQEAGAHPHPSHDHGADTGLPQHLLAASHQRCHPREVRSCACRAPGLAQEPAGRDKGSLWGGPPIPFALWSSPAEPSDTRASLLPSPLADGLSCELPALGVLGGEAKELQEAKPALKPQGAIRE